MKKGIVYQRFSSDDQSQHSFERQDLIITHWKNTHNIELLDTFKDPGISGRSFDRPNVQELLKFIRKNHSQVDYLIVSELSRFSREAGEAISLVQNIQKQYDIRIVSASRGSVYDCTDSNSFFMMGLEFLLGNSENIKRQNDINGGIYAAKVEKGKWIQGGPAPFGFDKVGEGKDRHLVWSDAIVPIIKYIFNAFHNGTPIYIIKEQAVKMGMTKKGKDPIGEILDNPIYMSFQKVKAWKDQPGGLFPIKDLPPIISPEMWWQVHNMRKGATRKQRTSISDNLYLRGKLICECGKPVTGGFSTGRKGVKYPYYKCNGGAHLNLSAKVAHDQMATIWQHLSLPYQITEAIFKDSLALMEQKQEHRKDELKAKNLKLSLLQSKIDSLEEKFISNQLNFETYNRWHNDLTRDREELNATIEGLKKGEEISYSFLKDNLEKMADLEFVWSATDTLGKHKMINVVFDNTLTYEKGTYRTSFLPPFLRHNAKKMNEKNILLYNYTGAEPGEVEATGIEPVSKHILQKLSTCLFLYYLSAMNRKRTNRFKA